MRSLARITLDNETASRWREYWRSREAWLKRYRGLTLQINEQTARLFDGDGHFVREFHLTDTPNDIDEAIGWQ